MKKIYLAVVALSFSAVAVNAQTKSQMPLSQRVKATIDQEPHTYRAERGGVTPIWSDDFSDPSNWVLDYMPGAPALNWQIGVGLENVGDFPTDPVASTTADNGYAMLDSDGFANQSLVEKSHMTTANPIDLSEVDRVVLQFESFYRKWTYEECFIIISTTNDDWPDLNPDSDISMMPNVFYVWPGMAQQEVISNPTLVRINISEAAGGEEQVWVRFYWTGTYGYSWFVDDVAIIEQPANDVVLNYSFLSHTGTGEEYGRIPASQMHDFMQVGGEFYNFGFETQTDINLKMEVFDEGNNIAFDANFSEASISTEVEVIVEDIAMIPVLSEGLYRSVTTVTSAEEQGGLFFDNNTHLRNFAVSDQYYSIDGLGLHPEGYQAVGSIGTNSFEDGEDGLMILAYYELIDDLTVYGVEFLITSTTTEVGSSVIVALHDSTDIRAGVVTNALVQAQIYDVTQEDIDAGYVRVLFDEPVVLGEGGYYAGLELFSANGEAHIRVLNDLSVPQPAFASMIYIPGDNVYTNGNASAVRLMIDQALSVQDATAALQGVNMFPNPSNGLVNITTASADRHLVEVFNMMGGNVLTTTLNGNGNIDLSGTAPGIYSVRVSNGEAQMVQRIVLQ